MLRKNHEQSIIDGFFDHFKNIADQHGENLTRCSSDGQDKLLGGDYIFTNHTRFVLAEFKYEEKDIKSEKKKTGRLNLCKNLDRHERRLQQSISCHFIGWSTRQHDRSVEFNKYYHEVCNTFIFPQTKALRQKAPNYNERRKADMLIKDFLDGNIGATYKAFELYIEWLLKLEGGGTNSVELLTRDPTSKSMRMIDFNSVKELKIWLDYIRPSQARKNNPGNSFNL
ncbi:hypothetical protein [Salinicola endophyticus]|uniref:hypothetical protein n=1 Tax=Salinicola endophyticus TaxID=1949083 RepID=UPI00130055EA|nr:hypothetical protein [Salinicola endophyticus]